MTELLWVDPVEALEDAYRKTASSDGEVELRGAPRAAEIGADLDDGTIEELIGEAYQAGD